MTTNKEGRTYNKAFITSTIILNSNNEVNKVFHSTYHFEKYTLRTHNKLFAPKMITKQ